MHDDDGSLCLMLAAAFFFFFFYSKCFHVNTAATETVTGSDTSTRCNASWNNKFDCKIVRHEDQSINQSRVNHVHKAYACMQC